jgi:hypothetical protein
VEAHSGDGFGGGFSDESFVVDLVGIGRISNF